MRIRVLLFGQLKDIVGKPEETLDLAPGASLSDVVADYGHRFAQFQPLAGSIACALNQEYAPASALLKDGDEVGLLPPVSGGAQAESEAQPELKSPHCAIVQERIATPQIADSLKAPEDGATVIFEGIVRNNTRGRRTLYLHYEAYKPMAVNEMEKLAQQALEQFKIRDVRLVHRLGRLEIGETSVLIVVSSAHRGAAFDACRWIIDTLKKTVPIWKKEYFADGAVWADGEPFPEDIHKSKNFGPTTASN
ncbi:MAG: molybdopterin synthase [Candidatus Angelobacter sp. Gp1-AA117]|nr:MAG: molybdopterin synthase [Candidatus Angelobacter sp. Gp1-AA117]